VSAAAAVQAAVVAALTGDAIIAQAVSGVWDGPPRDPALPYLAVEGGTSADWSVKGARGREHRVAVTVWDDAMASARLHGLMAAAEEAIEAMPRRLGGHRVASLAFLRGRIVRDAAGPWAGLIEYRLRTIEIEED